VVRTEKRWRPPASRHAQQTGMAVFPDAKQNIWFSQPHAAGGRLVSESMDGKQVAPLMAITPAGCGTLRVRTLPISGTIQVATRREHAAPSRWPQQTAVRVYWLVDEKAVAGRDYELTTLMRSGNSLRNRTGRFASGSSAA